MPPTLAILLLVRVPASALDIGITSDPPLPAPNLVQNPGFEEGEGEGEAPLQWRWGTAVPENFDVAWADNGRTGKCVSLIAHSAVMSGYWNQSVKVEPDTDYVLTGWFRLRGGRLLSYVHGAAPDGHSIDERFYASSMQDYFLVPVFLKAEYMAGLDPDSWHSLRVPFHTLAGMEAIAVSLGMYFAPGEVAYDDICLRRATTDLRVHVRSPDQAISRVRVLTSAGDDAAFDGGPLPAGETDFERTVPAVATDAQYTVEVTAADGQVTRRTYPEVARP